MVPLHEDLWEIHASHRRALVAELYEQARHLLGNGLLRLERAPSNVRRENAIWRASKQRLKAYTVRKGRIVRKGDCRAHY